MKKNISTSLYKDARKLMPGGVNSPVRAFKNVKSNPIFFKSAKGPFLFDEDGNKYIDFIGSWGPMILGHSNLKILKAMRKQMRKGVSYGAPSKVENEMAKLVKKNVKSIQKIRMVNSGTEATMSCIRLARGYTGRNAIIKFDGCYHGHVDSLLIKAGSGVSTFGLPDSPGIPDELAKYTISVPYNDEKAFLEAFNKVKKDLAAVIIEPIAGNMGFIKSQISFLELLREKTKKNKTLLIFDEVMTGFRVAMGGAQDVYKISPDLTALGKIIGGGLPVGAFGGSSKIMNQLAPDGPIYQAGTLSGNPLAMSAGVALINELERIAPYNKLEKLSSYMLTEISRLMQQKNINFSYDNLGGMFGFFMSKKLPKNYAEVVESDTKLFIKFFNSCLKNGIYFAPSKFEAGFISSTHNKKIVDDVLSKVEKSLGEII